MGWVCRYYTLHRELFPVYSSFPLSPKPKFDLICSDLFWFVISSIGREPVLGKIHWDIAIVNGRFRVTIIYELTKAKFPMQKGKFNKSLSIGGISHNSSHVNNRNPQYETENKVTTFSPSDYNLSSHHRLFHVLYHFLLLPHQLRVTNLKADELNS